MTSFDLVRAGWPNVMAVVALAAMPLMALAMPPEPAPAAAVVQDVEAPVAVAAIPAEME
jgi:hypothetical protein